MRQPVRAGIFATLCLFAAMAVSSATIRGGLQDATLIVVTYNIRYDNPADGDDRWERRRDAMAEYLRNTGADVIGLQEAEPAQRAYLAERLPAYAWYGVGRNAEHDQGEGTPIFYRRDRFEIFGTGTFWLSPTPSAAGSVGWDAALPRVASWVKLRDRRSGGEVFAINTHFDHRGPEARLQSSRLLIQKIDELATDDGRRLPVVLTGDFNSRPEQPPYAALLASAASLRLNDAQHASLTPHQGGDSTSNAFKAISPGAKIDYVFVRDMTVLSHRIEDPRIDGRFVSDHQPIVVQLRVP